MYTILIGTFVLPGCMAVVLTQQPKLSVMSTNVINPESSTRNLKQDLIEACKRGDQKAQFKIYKLYYKIMYNSSLVIVNDPAETEYIIQESFFAAFEEIGNFSGSMSFGSWLLKIVQNRTLDTRQKKHSK
jgi:hypothetical protein